MGYRIKKLGAFINNLEDVFGEDNPNISSLKCLDSTTNATLIATRLIEVGQYLLNKIRPLVAGESGNDKHHVRSSVNPKKYKDRAYLNMSDLPEEMHEATISYISLQNPLQKGCFWASRMLLKLA